MKMGDNLDIAAAVLLVFIAVVSLEIVLAFGRLITWLSNKVRVIVIGWLMIIIILSFAK